jgi:DNA invertase Pin-like site-specific DNA recombinase
MSKDKAAVAYLRCSTEEQARSGLGLAAQLERVKAYATMAGLDLVAIVSDEGVSGSVELERRAGGRELLAIVSKHKASHVVALKLDRLFRDAADCLNQTKAWDRAGVALHLLDMGGQAINTASAMGRMFLTMAAGFAELERNLISERTSQALAVKRGKGEKTGGDVPFGYKLAADGVHLEAHPAEQEAIAMIQKWHGRGWSYRRIARELNAAGVITKRGAQWTHVQVSSVVKRAA